MLVYVKNDVNLLNKTVIDRPLKEYLEKVFDSFDIYISLEFTDTDSFVIDNIKSLILFEEFLNNEIKEFWYHKNVYISKESSIGIDVILEDDVCIKGNSKILKKSIIKKGSSITDSMIYDSIIDNNVVIENSKVIDSKVGDNTTVGPYAHLRGGNTIGCGVRIGNFVEIKHSTIGDKSKIAHLAYVGDTVMGTNVNFGCGAITVNYDGVNKYKTIIEDNVFVGSNSNLIAPIILKKNSFIACGSTITDSLEENDFAIARERQIIKKNYKNIHNK